MARTLTAGLIAAGALLGIAAAAPASDPRPEQTRGAFVKHEERYWSWFGPRNFVATSSAYGITIVGPGRDGASIDYGGSSTLCDGPPQQHFDGERRSFASNPRLSRVRFRKVSRIRMSGGTYSQTMKFSARAGGRDIGGTLGFQYASYDGTYCYRAALFRGAARNRDFKDSMRTLNAIWDRTFYFGPGLPIDPDTGLP